MDGARLVAAGHDVGVVARARDVLERVIAVDLEPVARMPVASDAETVNVGDAAEIARESRRRGVSPGALGAAESVIWTRVK